MTLEQHFPGLKNTDYAIISPRTPKYNCIAWAVGDTTRFWWPRDEAYWPPTVPKEATIDALVQAFETLGYAHCNTADKENGIEKVAIYAKGQEPKHAARQLKSGMWTSKLGNEEDIVHTLDGLAGEMYGDVVRLLMRQRS